MQVIFTDDGNFKESSPIDNLMIERKALYDDLRYKINLMNIRKRDLVKKYLNDIKGIDNSLKYLCRKTIEKKNKT